MDNLLAGLDQQPQIDNYFNELVGEGKKFKDTESLAKGKYEADTYIKTLEHKLDTTMADWAKEREEYNTRAKLQDLVDQLSRQQPQDQLTPPPVQGEKPSLDLTQIKSLVSEEMSQIEKQRRQKENFDRVQKTLKDRFGSSLNDRLQEIGLDGTSAAQIAKDNPDLLLRALGTNQQQSPGFQAPPRNSSGFTPQPPQKRTWSYYQELRKKNPNLYYDPKTNVQMQKDYIALGTAFEDGDFKQFGDGVSVAQ